MIVWGSKGRTFDEGEGVFNCPSCGQSNPYKLKVLEKWFTLYWLPIFPLEKLGKYVECQVCKSSYEPSVLEYDPEKESRQFRALFEYHLLRVMCFIILADGKIEQGEKDQAATVFANLTGKEVSGDDLDEIISEVSSASGSLEGNIENLRDLLNEEGRELVLRGAIEITLGDDDLDQTEIEVLHSLSKGLAISQLKANEIFSAYKIPLC